MIKVMIADDHDMVRSGLRKILELEKDFEVVGEAGTGQTTINLCRELSPDVLLLDLDMPDTDGLDVIPQIVSMDIKTKILVLTMHDNVEYLTRAFKSGASGYLLKGSSSDELPPAIRAVHSGKKYICPVVAEKMAMRSFAQHGDNPVSTLSDRELQVLKKVAVGKKLKEIADELFLSINTASTYKKRVKEKLGLNNDIEIAEYARKKNLIASDDL